MQFDADFYQRRLTQQLTMDHGDSLSQAAAPQVSLASEAAILALADDSDFVRQTYRFFLQRDPDLVGLRYFCDMAKQQGRLTVIAEIKKSDEAQRKAHTKTPDSALATAPELSALPSVSPWADPAILEDSPELTDLMDIADPETFLTAAYRRTLGRDPDPDGWDHHLLRLRTGEPRDAILQGLATSGEAKARGVDFTWQGMPLRGSGLRAGARAMVARFRPGAAHRREGADLRRAQKRLERSLLEVRAGQQQLERMIQALSADVAQQSRNASSDSTALTALSTQMAAEVQRTRDAHRSLHNAVDALASRVEAGITRGVRTSVIAGDNIVASEVEGFIIGVPGEEWRLAAYHTFRGALEPGLTRRFRDTLRPGMVVVDVGANVGMYTLIAARLVGPAGRVFSFEPTPRTFAILKDNIQINGFLEAGFVRFQRVAITDRIGTARFGVYAANGGHNTLFPADRDTAFIDVETTTLDAALADVPRVDVVKIDAEGAEPLIWAGMTATLARNPGIRIFMEFAPGLLERGKHDPAGFFAQIESDGFHVHLVDDVTGAIRKTTYAQLRPIVSSNLMLTRVGR